MVPFKEFKDRYPNFEECSIQYFDDVETRKDKTMAWICHVSMVDWNDIKARNDKWCWVFFSVNTMKRPEKNDKWRMVHYRDKNSTIHINSRFAESDSTSKEEQMKLIESAPIKPSMVIESNKSYHIYYFAEDWDFESFEEIELWLYMYFKWDRSFMTDYARVLRLPWLNHQKDIDKPFQIKCLWLEDKKYTKEEMIKSFPYNPELDPFHKKAKKAESKPLSISESNNIWEFMASLWNESMMFRIHRSSLVNWESIDLRANSDWSNQIWCNWKSTWAWIDSSDYIWSTNWWWPTWIQWCEWYWKSKPDILKWFFEYCSDIIPSRFDRTAKQVALEKAVDEQKKDDEAKKLWSSFKHIKYSEKVIRWFDELISTDPNTVMKFWWSERDEMLWWIYGGKIMLVGGETGTGKAQPLYSKILTPSWRTTMWQIKIWDEVMWSDWTTKKVTMIPFYWDQNVFRLHMSDWSYCDAWEHHEFRVKYNLNHKPNQEKDMEVFDIAVLTKYWVRLRIENTKPLITNEKDLPLDPYTLWALIWDWCCNQSSINFTTADPEMIWNLIFPEWDEIIKKRTSKYCYRIRKNSLKWDMHNKPSKTKSILWELWLLTTSYYKKIPEIYKMWSIEQRIELLKWLMDTDWTVENQMNRENTRLSFSTSSEQLAKDFMQLVKSLWWCGTTSSRIPTYNWSDWRKLKWMRSRTISFWLPDWINAFKLERKLSRVRSNSNMYTYIDRVEFLWIMPTQCISVEDQMYITDDYIPTHNTTFINQVALNLASAWVRVTRYSLEDRMEDNAKEEIYYAINRLRAKEFRPKIDWIKFVNNEYMTDSSKYYDEEVFIDAQRVIPELQEREIMELEKTKDVNINELVELMEQECDKWTRVFFIDHLHYFKYENDKQREDLQIEAAMKWINEVARKRNVAVFLVAHYSSSWVKDWKANINSFKWSSAIKQIANIIIQLVRVVDEDWNQTGQTMFQITKLRWPIPKNDIYSRFDISTYEYSFEKSEDQKQKEKEVKKKTKRFTGDP